MIEVKDRNIRTINPSVPNRDSRGDCTLSRHAENVVLDDKSNIDVVDDAFHVLSPNFDRTICKTGTKTNTKNRHLRGGRGESREPEAPNN